jgi:DNA replication ATP-dependent helicase/nuclease Dna2
MTIQIIQHEGQLSDQSEANGSVSRISLTKLHEVEEEIWSPTYGIKGKIDASVQVLILQESRSPTGNPASGTLCSWTMPFEIKTGRTVGVLEHRAQIILYTILMAERYSKPSILLFLHTAHILPLE